MFKSLLSAIFNKLTSVFNVCPVIDYEFRPNIVKVAVDPRGDSRVDLQTTLTMLRRNSLSVIGQTNQFVFYDSELSNFPLVA